MFVRKFGVSIALASATLLCAVPASAVQGIVTSAVPLPDGLLPLSPITGPDGNIWFSAFPYGGNAGYIVRLQSGGVTTFYPLPTFTGNGVPTQPTMALGLANAPRPSASGARLLVFNWLAYDPTTQLSNESGFGTIDVDNPTKIQEYAAQNPGDPLYNPAFVFEAQTFKITTTSSPPAVWTYAHTAPNSSIFPPDELIASIPFPFPAVTAAVFPAFLMPRDYSGTEAIVLGADGNIWFQGYSSLGRIAPSGEQSFPVPGYPSDIAVTGTNLWLSLFPTNLDAGIPGTSYVGYGGTVVATYPWPFNLGYQVFFTAATPDAVWSSSFNSNIGAVYFMRMAAATGQWSAYPVAGPRGTRPFLTVAMVAPDGTIWISYGTIAGPGALLSLRTNRVLSTMPVQLALKAGQSAQVRVQESNYPRRQFMASVSENCPLTVTSGKFPGFFTVTVMSNNGFFFCGVTFSDVNGVSVWLPVTDAAREASPNAALRGQILEKYQLPLFGRQIPAYHS